MHNLLKINLSSIIALILCVFSLNSYAAAIMQVVPNMTQAIAPASGNATIGYVVTNTTNKSVINNITIDPTYTLSGNPSSVSIVNNRCSNISLAVGASCTFDVLLSGSAASSVTTIAPRVCAYSGAICSMPLEINRVSITTTTKRLFAYIANNASNGGTTVSICPVKSDGTLGTCVVTTGNGTFSAPRQVAFNSKSSIAYIANRFNHTVSVCPVRSDGLFGTCTTSSGNGVFSQINGIVINPTDNFAYNSNIQAFGPLRKLGTCSINPDGSIGLCSYSSVTTFGVLQGVTINAQGTIVYAVDGSNQLNICSVNPDYTITTCTIKTDPTFSYPQGVSLNSAGTFIYIPNYNTNTVSICPVTSNGGIGACSVTNGNGTFNFSGNFVVAPYFKAVNGYGYVPNLGNNTISICPVTGTGSLGTCVTSNGNGTLNGPTGITLALI